MMDNSFIRDLNNINGNNYNTQYNDILNGTIKLNGTDYADLYGDTTILEQDSMAHMLKKSPTLLDKVLQRIDEDEQPNNDSVLNQSVWSTFSYDDFKKPYSDFRKREKLQMRYSRFKDPGAFVKNIIECNIITRAHTFLRWWMDGNFVKDDTLNKIAYFMNRCYEGILYSMGYFVTKILGTASYPYDNVIKVKDASEYYTTKIKPRLSVRNFPWYPKQIVFLALLMSGLPIFNDGDSQLAMLRKDLVDTIRKRWTNDYIFWLIPICLSGEWTFHDNEHAIKYIKRSSEYTKRFEDKMFAKYRSETYPGPKQL